tara:strand:- start:225 stop:476 length:252 start_codon:yes stop_codon:yes gene_type:complete
MKILYFSWVRDQIGKSSDEFDIPNEINTLSKLIIWLSEKNPKYKKILLSNNTIRFAINHEFADLENEIIATDEIAIFPPVTGG